VKKENSSDINYSCLVDDLSQKVGLIAEVSNQNVNQL